MLSRVLSLCAALILAVGIAAVPAGAKSKKPATPKKSTAKKSTAKKSTAKKDTRKSSKKNARDASAKSSKKSKKGKKEDSRTAKSRSRKVTKKDDRSAKRATTPKRGKNGEEEKWAPTRTTQRDSRVAASSPVVRPVAVVAGDSMVEGQDPDAPPAPKPANRIVADIAPARVIQIQNALISQGLLAGPANGVYDQPTFAAMSAFQSRKGYKPLGVPTADSLKALGVPKNSGRTYMSASRVLESTAPRQE